jgi:membrane associated rhomboid family serine protease
VGIANAAHATGLVIGMLLGLVFGTVAKISKR